MSHSWVGNCGVKGHAVQYYIYTVNDLGGSVSSCLCVPQKVLFDIHFTGCESKPGFYSLW